MGVLVLHGFGGSPYSMQEYALRFVDAGHSVALPLLTGHGSTPQDMEKARWTDWTGDADSAYGWLEQRADRIFVTGLSMGGTLALWAAERHPEVAGIVTVNAALRFREEPLMHLLGVLGFPRWLKTIGNDIRKPGQDERAYSKIPVRAMRQLGLLLRDVRKGLAANRLSGLTFLLTRRSRGPTSQSARDIRKDQLSGQDTLAAHAVTPLCDSRQRQGTDLRRCTRVRGGPPVDVLL